jgi:hypothetical protein
MRTTDEIKVNRKKLSTILKAHKKWRRDEKGGIRAYLSGADLRSADLRSADLNGAYLIGAYLNGAYLIGADLRGADLSGADLRSADLSGAYLSGAYLIGADLRGAYLIGAENIPEYVFAVTGILPDGAFIGWKKCNRGIIAKLEIPAKAKRSNATGRKCRAEYVKVLALYQESKELPANTVAYTARHGSKTAYQKGKITKCNKFDEDRWQECSGGIHFFITRYEAEQW